MDVELAASLDGFSISDSASDIGFGFAVGDEQGFSG
ncbi:MAG: hypothetical protein ACI845_000398 [Gammaproteobacteria bacterium]|jgi:hypothetical protein